MKNRIKFALLLNCIVVVATTAVSVSYYFYSENPLVETGFDSYKFFTTDSNILAAITSLVMIPLEIQILRGKRDRLPHAAIVFKYVGMASVMLTFSVVMLLLVWIYGAPFTLLGTSFYTHLAGPLIAFFTFCFLETDSKIGLRETLLPIIPCVLYGMVYFYEVLIVGEANGGWMDFYAFNSGGYWYIISPVVFGYMYLIAIVTRLLHNRFSDKRGGKMQEPAICGGTTRNVDKDAPKTIKSDKMTLFSVESSLEILAGDEAQENTLDFISAYAAKLDGGSFILLETRSYYENENLSWAYIAEDVFPELVKMTADEELAKYNGTFSVTHGLPKNFGGEVKIEYESGEKIGFSDNQCPIITRSFALKLYNAFGRMMKAARAPLPDADSIVSVRFYEESKFGFTRAELKKNGDEYELKTEYKFEEPKVYDSSRIVPEDVIVNIKNRVKESAVLLWNKFPKKSYEPLSRKTLTFVLEDGSKIEITDDRALPAQLSGAFFKIELELTSSN